jgi:hypothetical protein
VSGLERVVHGWLGAPLPLIAGAPIGASVPSFLAAFGLAWFLLRPARARRPGAAG